MSDSAHHHSDGPIAGKRSLLAWGSVIGMIILYVLLLLAYPPLADAGKPVPVPQWVLFFGRFHPIAVHMPVGVLILAAVMEGLALFKPRLSSLIEPAITFVLGFGTFGAIIAVIFGIFLSREGGSFGNGTFQAHQTLGIVATWLSLLALLCKVLADGGAKFMWPYRAALGLALFVMSVGAHFGGNMVHGNTYLIEYAPEGIKKSIESTEGSVIAWFAPAKAKDDKGGAAPANANPTVYAALIAPALEDTCNSCHNEKKSKGKLRMDTYELLIKGGGSGDNVVPGDPVKSLLTSRLILPVDDDDHMPPAKEKQPSKEAIALLTWWVKEGASNTMTVADAKFPEEIKTYTQTLLSKGKGGSSGGPAHFIVMAEAAAAVDPAVAEAMKKINGSGASLAPVAAESKELRFTALNVAKDFADSNLKDLEAIASSITVLDLAKTKVTDAGVAAITKFVNLRELHLENTAITDAGASQLKSLTKLEYLNLYGTKITDKTLVELGGLAKLKSFYAWQTGVTKEGAAAYKAKNPNVAVNTGWTEADNAKVVASVEGAKPPVETVAKATVPAAPVAAPTAKKEVAVGKADAAGGTGLSKAADANAKLYADIVAPIIEAKCTSCHGKEKSKGKLRMHTFADLLKGGSDGATTVIAGKPADSLMLKRISLTKDDDDHMPPKDEPQITKEEQALLTWWIEQGANEALTVATAKKTPDVEAALKLLASAKPAAAAVAKAPEKPKAKPLTDAEKKAIAEVTAKMTTFNASLMPLALDTEQLRFGCVNAADKIGDKELAELAPVAQQLLWVELARTKITDAGLATVSKMSNLERLHLENTAVTDAGIAQLAGLAKLEYLNLYGTKVTDAGLAKLATAKSLKKVFVWQTAVTKDAAKKLEAAIPGLVVNVGLSEAEIAKLSDQIKPPTPPAPEVKKPEAAKPAAPAPKPAAKPDAPAAKPEVKPAIPAKPVETPKPTEPKK